jgi:hypothetical protein
VRIFARPVGVYVLRSGGPLKPKFLFIVSLSCLLLVGPGYAKRRHSAVKQPVKQEQPAVQAAPTPPSTLAEMSASPPQVSFQGGQLTISAQNSTLGDILKAVRAQTSATIDLPGNAPERVVGHFGPGPARDVLTSLLNGSHFNYLLLGSPTDPSALDRVILMAKSSSAAESNPQPPSEQANAFNQAVYNRPTAMPMAAPGGNTEVVEGQDATDDTADDSADSTDDAQADDQTDQTDQADEQQAGEEPQQQPDGQQSVKTPEQLLQQLQQRQQQIQQQGMQPGAAGFPTPGQPGLPGPPHN